MANLSQLREARIAAKRFGWKVRSMKGGNDHYLLFTHPEKGKIKVWYPWDGRSGNAEEKDLDDVIAYISKGA